MLSSTRMREVFWTGLGIGTLALTMETAKAPNDPAQLVQILTLLAGGMGFFAEGIYAVAGGRKGGFAGTAGLLLVGAVGTYRSLSWAAEKFVEKPQEIMSGAVIVFGTIVALGVAGTAFYKYGLHQEAVKNYKNYQKNNEEFQKKEEERLREFKRTHKENARAYDEYQKKFIAGLSVQREDGIWPADDEIRRRLQA